MVVVFVVVGFVPSDEEDDQELAVGARLVDHL
jgi:hypothetical protein